MKYNSFHLQKVRPTGKEKGPLGIRGLNSIHFKLLGRKTSSAIFVNSLFYHGAEEIFKANTDFINELIIPFDLQNVTTNSFRGKVSQNRSILTL